ncbi:MAG TPA: DUF2087 domain-containing protein [candidate division Zixibacteria bacterium]|nr:DUF2087 domain-containing protein [candidate division Zixibacteria bacterium]MDD4916802.1 DUF2087 domain-containing protein [candidate division Zixibacteria bacterium]HOD65196.1 DUF2087 domain-containing protein [candidate division Zixibacteria bacterium]HOZ07912.1 DUF2087 domain-containing protein [candidate division Zixibacteria bacterium]HPI31759.1 DUF2087 domain-containing protein [candidate division Zixibacteria bacterium]
MNRITAVEFRARLEALCTQRNNPGLPRRRRDQLILLGSIVRELVPGRTYSEPDINAVIAAWLADVGRSIDIDFVSLRRQLVDEGFLARDPAGNAYRLEPQRTADLFEPETAAIDPAQAVREARERREKRRQAHR